ncbi:MAG: EAL domain-containing response regulator [Myxococcota bacterium]
MSRILVVDDEPQIVRMMERILIRDAHEVCAARDGQEAIALAKGEAFDMALVDYRLPGVDGLSVFQELCTLQPGCARILMSGRLDTPLIIDAVNQGRIHRVLSKPLSLEALREAVQMGGGLRAQLAEGWRRIQEREQVMEKEVVHTLLEDHHLRLALQPIISAKDLSLVAHEALMRSSHPALPNPLAVLQAAERCGMITDLGAEVARQAALWVPRLPANTSLFVNLHPAELMDTDLLLRNLSPLRPWADQVVLEITEHSHVHPGSTWMTCIQALRMEGFAIAVDDLGAGYNSLAVLATLQPDYIKVDMSIVRDVDFDPYKQRLIALLAQLADSTGSTLIAEGVETNAEADVLRSSDVHLMQGYLFGRPSTEPDFSQHLKTRMTA